jgi:hypothetical protein
VGNESIHNEIQPFNLKSVRWSARRPARCPSVDSASACLAQKLRAYPRSSIDAELVDGRRMFVEATAAWPSLPSRWPPLG